MVRPGGRRSRGCLEETYGFAGENALFTFPQNSGHNPIHDLKKQIYELSEVLKEFQIAPQQVARLVLANTVLGVWRSPAFYGDERLRVASLFDSKEAELALSYAELGQLVCNIVRSQLYRRATTG